MREHFIFTGMAKTLKKTTIYNYIATLVNVEPLEL